MSVDQRHVASSGGRAPSPPDRWVPDRPPPDARRSLAQLGLIVLAVVVAALATHTTDLLIVIVSLIVMIMLHELGHFATAKWSHMKVTEYFLGFGPRLWSVRRGETEYGIKALPLGGYVKILGMSNLEDVDPADEARTYRQQPFRKRLLVVCAGSAMHGVIAFLLLWGFLTVAGEVSSSTVQVQSLAPLAHNVDPARDAGIQAGDVITAVDGHKVTGQNVLIDAIKSRPGQSVSLTVQRDGKAHDITVTPATVPVKGKAPEGHIGVVLTEGMVPIGPVRAFGHAATGLGQLVTGTFSALGQIFSAHGLSQYWRDLTNAKAATASEHSTTRLQSIYGAVRTTVQGVQAGWGAFVAVFASINVFIGIVNLVPMLPLDGGHVAVAVYERIRSRRGRMYHADVRKLAPVAYAFVLFLGFIVTSALYLDITHPVSNPFH